MRKKRTPVKPIDPEELRAWLEKAVSELFDALTDDPDLSVREGKVMTEGKPPYRRLDCDGKALAYVRMRPKKRAVRIDVTGLWKTPRSSRLLVPNAGGSATLMVKSGADTKLAIRYLKSTVERTRAARTKDVEPPAAGDADRATP